MTHKNFNQIVDTLEATRIDTLKTKNAKYAPADDALHNFRTGAEIMNCTVPQCIWGYATKHIVALRDKIERNDFYDLDDTLEKIQDIQNYLTFIWAAANEVCEEKLLKGIKEYSHLTTDKADESSCCNCKHWDICDNDDNWSEGHACTSTNHIITEPCKSCQYNISPNSPEYDNAPISWEAANA